MKLLLILLVTYLTQADFRAKVFDYQNETEWCYAGETPCVIDFYTTWCGPCKRLAPIMEELSKEYEGKVIFYKADIEKEPELAQLFRITSIPQVLYIPAGNAQPWMTKGLYPKEAIVSELKKLTE